MHDPRFNIAFMLFDSEILSAKSCALLLDIPLEEFVARANDRQAAEVAE